MNALTTTCLAEERPDAEQAVTRLFKVAEILSRSLICVSVTKTQPENYEQREIVYRESKEEFDDI
jgi:hypothetical protein